jgi:ketosteroid isomerase-like protein
LVLMVIVLVVSLGLAVVGVALYQGVRSIKVAREVVNEYFTALEERRFDDAYLMLHPDTRFTHPREAFESALDARPPMAHELRGELRFNRMPRRTSGTVGVLVTYADGTSDARKVSLSRQDGDWLVCGSPY